MKTDYHLLWHNHANIPGWAAPIDALTQTRFVSASTVAANMVHTFITAVSMHCLSNAFLFDITACTILHKYLGVATSEEKGPFVITSFKIVGGLITGG